MSTIPKGPDLCYARGDTGPMNVRFKDDGKKYDLTGYTVITLTVDTLENPTDALTNVMAFGGTFDTDRESGLVGFRPPSLAASDALTPAAGLFYDVQATNAAGELETLCKGGDFEILQDINKS